MAFRKPELPSGRTRSFDRAIALRVAVRMFAERGYAATRIADLCNAMGIATPSFYAAFTSKEAVYEEAIELVASDKVEAIFSAFDTARTTRAGIEEILLRTIEEGSRPDGPAGCLVTLSFVGDEDSPTLGALGRQKRSMAYEAIRSWLEEGVARGHLPPEADAEAIARMIAMFQQGVAVQSRDGVPRGVLEAAVLALMAGWPWTGTPFQVQTGGQVHD
jgi:AcrR family transcriptional regulator